MKRIVAFAFFLLFLAGIALVNLAGSERSATPVNPAQTASDTPSGAH